MNGYYIFVIVVTIGLVLYYVALINIDLHKLKRSKEDAEENISADGSPVDDAPIVPQVVSEGKDGVVSISAPEQAPNIDAISEADEETDSEQTLSEQESDKEDLGRQQGLHNEGNEDQQQDAEDENNEANEDKQEHNDQAPTEDIASDEDCPGETEAAVSETEAEDSDREEADKADEAFEEDEAGTPKAEDGFEVLNITPDTIEDVDNSPEPEDASSAFDASLIQPAFGVQQMVGPQASPAAMQKAELVNESLMKNRARGRIEHSSEVVKNLIKNSELSKAYNIATKNEFNRC